MAAAGRAHVKFFCTSESAFYFEDLAETGAMRCKNADVDEDAFNISTYRADQHLIRCKDNKFLILTAEENIEVQNLTTEQQCQPEHKFNIQFYKDNKPKEGRAVMLYAKPPTKDNKKIVVCCNEKHEIQPEEMDLPQQIEESGHKAVFYRTKLSTSYYLLESSLYPTEFLGLEPHEENLSKLVLCHKRKDEVNENCQFIFSP